MGADAVTITLPVPPVAFAVEPARLVAWLVGRGYALAPSRHDKPTWLTYMNQERRVLVLPNPSEWEAGEYTVALAESVGEAAEIAGIEARDLAAQLGPTVEGPALQWEHMSPTARAATTAAIAALAHASRVDAATWRAVGNVESALAAEGRAMGLEAAVAALGGAASR